MELLDRAGCPKACDDSANWVVLCFYIDSVYIYRYYIDIIALNIYTLHHEEISDPPRWWSQVAFRSVSCREALMLGLEATPDEIKSGGHVLSRRFFCPGPVRAKSRGDYVICQYIYIHVYIHIYICMYVWIHIFAVLFLSSCISLFEPWHLVVFCAWCSYRAQV